MRNILHQLVVINIISGIGVSACAPLSNSTYSEPTPAITAANATATPKIAATETIESATQQPVEISKGTLIQFWHPWSGELANLMAEMTDEFNRTNEWGIVVDVEFHSDEIVFIEDMNQAITEGNPPDFIAAPGYFLRTIEENGFDLQNLQNYIDSRDWGLSEDVVNSFLPIFWNADNQADKRIGIPAYQSGQFIFLNKTWAKELGFSGQLSDPDDFKDLTCEAGSAYLNDNDLTNNGTGGWVYTYDPNSFFSWLKAFGGGYGSDDERPADFGSPANIQSGTFLYDLFLDNCAWIGRQQQPFFYFANRQALAYSGGMEDILIQERVNELNDATDQWSVVPYPSILGEPILLIDGESYAITAKDAEKALASWIFVRWLLTPENQVRIIETTGSFPISGLVIELLNDYKNAHPVWADALKYLPMAQKIPKDPKWGLTKKVLADLSWKLIQFNSKREDIPVFFQDAQNLLAEIAK